MAYCSSLSGGGPGGVTWVAQSTDSLNNGKPGCCHKYKRIHVCGCSPQLQMPVRTYTIASLC